MARLYLIGCIVLAVALGRDRSDTRVTDSQHSTPASARGVTEACAAASDTVLAHATTDSARAIRAARAAYGHSGLPLAVAPFRRSADSGILIQLRPADIDVSPDAGVVVTDGEGEFQITADCVAHVLPGHM